ncbi:DNA sulfur modification protein DndD [Maridesulfovibrio sp.]|uniref:DNA sulfur modification protein DndD n=1 Tax=Maridesulfovibrio sp. TaxID=2795000 RepID=UPI002A188A4A|nr:DNA sulfur modification protein DndD [Maridesulfovibrio sp.]
MLLSELILENFSVYGEVQHLDLSPKDSSHPIVLVGGLNGAGKTSLLTAIRLVLFGKRLVHLDPKITSYSAFLKKLINDPSIGESRVTLSFATYSQGVKDTYKVTRSWKEASGGRIAEKFVAHKNGKHDSVISSTWEEFIDSFIPVSIANLFFFDGEAVADMASKEGAQLLLKTGVEALLGINLLNRLQEDLSSLIYKKSQETADSEVKERLETLDNVLKQQQIEINDLKAEKKSIEKTLAAKEKELAKAEGEFKTSGAELFSHRKGIEEDLGYAQQELEVISAELRELAAGTLPLALIGNLIADTQKQEKCEQDAIKAKAVLEVLEERDQTFLEIVNKKAPSAYDELSKLLQADRTSRSDTAATEIILDMSEEGSSLLQHLPQRIEHEQKQAASLKSKYEQWNEKKDSLERKLSMIPPEESVAESIRKRDEAKQALSIAIDQMASIERKIAELEGSHKFKTAEKKRFLEKQAIEDAEQLVHDRVIKYAGIARNRVGEFGDAVLNKSVSHLEELILESTNLLLRKKGFITSVKINTDNYELVLRGHNERHIPLTSLSAGERQLVIISILWGLGRASGRPLPIIVDTPLGRLDSIHRNLLVEYYFPNVSHQTILLSTDTEIVGEAKEKLSEFIGASYTLQHDIKRHKTQITNGYFS